MPTATFTVSAYLMSPGLSDLWKFKVFMNGQLLAGGDGSLTHAYGSREEALAAGWQRAGFPARASQLEAAE